MKYCSRGLDPRRGGGRDRAYDRDRGRGRMLRIRCGLELVLSRLKML